MSAPFDRDDDKVEPFPVLAENIVTAETHEEDPRMAAIREQIESPAVQAQEVFTALAKVTDDYEIAYAETTKRYKEITGGSEKVSAVFATCAATVGAVALALSFLSVGAAGVVVLLPLMAVPVMFPLFSIAFLSKGKEEIARMIDDIQQKNVSVMQMNAAATAALVSVHESIPASPRRLRDEFYAVCKVQIKSNRAPLAFMETDLGKKLQATIVREVQAAARKAVPGKGQDQG